MSAAKMPPVTTPAEATRSAEGGGSASATSSAGARAHWFGLVELPIGDSDLFFVSGSGTALRFLGPARAARDLTSARAMGAPDALIGEWASRFRSSERMGAELQFEHEERCGDETRSLLTTMAHEGPADEGRTRFSYVTEDVSSRRSIEQQLASRDTLLRLAMESSLSVAFEWDIVRDRVRRLSSVEEALPATGARDETLDDVARVVHPEDRALFRGNVRAALESPDGAYRSEYRMLRPSGEVRWLSETGCVEHDASGRPTRLIGIAQDVTARRRDEEMLRRQAALIALSREPIGVWTFDGRIVDWNAGAEELYGFTKAEAVGQDIHTLLGTRRDVSLSEAMTKLERQGVWNGELRHEASDGRKLVVDSRQQLVRVDGQRFVLESNRDITARKRAEEALREADRNKDEFLAVLAHELRNPLAPVHAAVEILRRVGSQDPTATRARDVIERQVTHMARLIEDLLDVSRVARGKLTLKHELCNLVAIVREGAEDRRASLEGAGLTFRVEIPEEPLWVDGDPVRLTQMLGNLLQNAARFTSRGGEVKVRAERDDESGQALVRVSDQGVGIDPSFMPRLFEPFVQAQQGLARSEGGLGLGLALTRGLAKLHGGRITAASAGLGRGATFTIALPLVDPPPAARVAASPSRAGSRKLRILVVEDQPDAAEMLRELLVLDGHEVRVSLDGESALAAAKSMVPDVVLSDIGLPGALDGYGLARAVRADPSLRGVRLVALSGYSSDDARRRAREAGFEDVVAKPTSLAVIARVLAGDEHGGAACDPEGRAEAAHGAQVP